MRRQIEAAGFYLTIDDEGDVWISLQDGEPVEHGESFVLSEGGEHVERFAYAALADIREGLDRLFAGEEPATQPLDARAHAGDGDGALREASGEKG